MNIAAVYRSQTDSVVDSPVEDILHFQWLQASWTKTFLDDLKQQSAELLCRATNLAYTEHNVSVLLRERNTIERIIEYARTGNRPSP